MGIFFFYNNRKPRKFNYTPILYNPDEEERKRKLQDRIDKVKREMGVQPEEKTGEKKDFKGEFVSQTRHLKKRKEKENSGKSSFFANNGLLIIILVILFAIFFFWFLR
ncbi:hypothetical protein [uncultured Proteiniphilum sp.]|uniref:hypothetical protein n=1 Tax=uncultured Proteiniphilum sp. TaxID=497637 RepID=UPI00261F6C03|nr:hypothetical protein [uncultured Proteiniphilum sp.]